MKSEMVSDEPIKHSIGVNTGPIRLVHPADGFIHSQPVYSIPMSGLSNTERMRTNNTVMMTCNFKAIKTCITMIFLMSYVPLLIFATTEELKGTNATMGAMLDIFCYSVKTGCWNSTADIVTYEWELNSCLQSTEKLRENIRATSAFERSFLGRTFGFKNPFVDVTNEEAMSNALIYMRDMLDGHACYKLNACFMDPWYGGRRPENITG